MILNQANPSEAGEGVHLNIGCGNKIWDGFTNIDFPSNYSGKKPDIECDVREIPLPDEHADSAYAIHVLEHFYRWETEKVLSEWVRLLKPGGKLIIEVPCFDKVVGLINHYANSGKPLNHQMTYWALFGDPGYEAPEMVHKWCFTINELRHLMHKVGLYDVEVQEPQYHVKQRDMRVVGTK